MIRSDTTSFVVADEDTAIAFIQSVFAPWGSRVMIPGTGVLMNNRLSAFSTTPGDANVIAPAKRTVHTLNTFLAIRDGELVVGGGTPGGDYQVQSNIQSIVGVLNWGLDLQSAIDMPRWVLVNGNLAMESRFPPASWTTSPAGATTSAQSRRGTATSPAASLSRRCRAAAGPSPPTCVAKASRWRYSDGIRG